MSAYTPGPWEFSFTQGVNTVLPHANNLAHAIAQQMGDGSDSQYIGNARLIAQAPAMAEALRLACAYVALYTGNGASIIESEALSHYLRANNNVDAEAITRHCRTILSTIEGE